MIVITRVTLEFPSRANVDAKRRLLLKIIGLRFRGHPRATGQTGSCQGSLLSVSGSGGGHFKSKALGGHDEKTCSTNSFRCRSGGLAPAREQAIVEGNGDKDVDAVQNRW